MDGASTTPTPLVTHADDEQSLRSTHHHRAHLCQSSLTLIACDQSPASGSQLILGWQFRSPDTPPSRYSSLPILRSPNPWCEASLRRERARYGRVTLTCHPPSCSGLVICLDRNRHGGVTLSPPLDQSLTQSFGPLWSILDQILRFTNVTLQIV